MAAPISTNTPPSATSVESNTFTYANPSSFASLIHLSGGHTGDYAAASHAAIEMGNAGNPGSFARYRANTLADFTPPSDGDESAAEFDGTVFDMTNLQSTQPNTPSPTDSSPDKNVYIIDIPGRAPTPHTDEDEKDTSTIRRIVKEQFEKMEGRLVLNLEAQNQRLLADLQQRLPNMVDGDRTSCWGKVNWFLRKNPIVQTAALAALTTTANYILFYSGWVL